jgi:hypothetical protein
MGKQVKTPRFYVDMPTFLHATGQLGWDNYLGGAELLYMNCANPYINNTQNNLQFAIGHPNQNTPKTSFPINFCALLNHNLAEDNSSFTIPSYKGINANDGNNWRLEARLGYENVLNSTTTESDLMYNGSTIFTFTELNEYWRGFGVYYATTDENGNANTPDDYPHQLGSLVVGKYFDCPNSPDLNLTMSRRFDGIKSQKTIGGKTLSNIYYDGPTEWTMNNPDVSGSYKYPPFELDTTDSAKFDERVKSGLGRKGLRSWKLSFSYIAESDMWMENEVSNTLISDGETNPALNDPNPMLSDNSFNFVWNCTLGGTLPFIFQPDNSEDGRNPDQFAICTFRENTFSVDQVAPGTYSVEVTIDELA